MKATEDTAAIEKWIRSCNIYHIFFTLLKTLFYIRDIGDVHRSKPPPTVHYQKAMPDIDDGAGELVTECAEVIDTKLGLMLH